jgi:hypothetical protein
MRFDECGELVNRLAGPTGCYIQFSREDADARPFPCPPSAQDLAAAADREFKLVWHVVSLEASGLRYPLTRMPEFVAPEDVYYDLELYLSRQYYYRYSEAIDPFASETCAACGAALRVPSDSIPDDAIYSFQMYRHCPACGFEFRPEDRASLVRHARTGAGRMVPGGATSRFSLAVDCGKCYACDAAPTREFLAACEDALGVRLEHVVDGSG